MLESTMAVIRRIETNHRQINYPRIAFLVVIACLLITLTSFGQSQNQSASSRSNEDEADIECQLVPSLNMVLVEVEVKDRFGNHVSNLSHVDFIVYEDGKKQEIVFSSEEMRIGVNAFPEGYVIGYLPPDQVQQGEFRRIRLKVPRAEQKGFRIRYSPKGYYLTAHQ